MELRNDCGLWIVSQSREQRERKKKRGVVVVPVVFLAFWNVTKQVVENEPTFPGWGGYFLEKLLGEATWRSY